MKAPFVSLVCLVALTFAGVAQAGPTSKLYLTYTSDGGNYSIAIVQGNSVIQTFPTAYSPSREIPIAVYGDIRTVGELPGTQGGQYSLGGTPTGTLYTMSGIVTDAYDSATDGSHNYLVDYGNGMVYQTARDFTNPVALFNAGSSEVGITYDAANHSLWISDWNLNSVSEYSLNGILLSSFSTGHRSNGSLALDPADQTLWLVNDAWNGNSYNGILEQYSKAGVLLSTGPYVGSAYGGEFDLAPTTPEPGTLIMFGSGILGLAGVLRRKITL